MDIYLITVLSSSYGSITDCEINAPFHGNNIIGGINATGNHYLKEQMKLICTLASNDTSNIAIIYSASKYISVKLSYQCIHILNNKEVLNGLKGSTKSKIENHYSNINKIYKMFKLNPELTTEVWKWYGTTTKFHS